MVEVIPEHKDLLLEIIL